MEDVCRSGGNIKKENKMSQKIYLSSQFDIHDCITCGTIWAMPSEYIDRRRDDHKTFYCPNGHSAYFPQKSDKEKLQEQLEHCKTDIKFWQNGYDAKSDNLKTVEHSRRAYKGQVTQLKKEIHGENGV